MHPSKRDLKDYLSNKLEDKKAVVVKEHLESCEFCQELLENMKLFEESMQQVVTDLPPRALRQANQLYIASLKGKTIEISPLFDSEQPTTLLLAADGAKEPVFGVENISTLFSEDPGLILRIMRDHDNKIDYMQLITEEKDLSSYVMVQIPELDFECLTDSNGKAVISGVELENIEKLKWQIKMPDAVFSLEPMIYDPDKTEYSKELDLITDNKDRINVKFEGKTEGKRISIKILELDGKKDYGDLKVTLVQQGASITKGISQNKSIVFELSDPDAEINIRLFRQ